MNLAQAKKTSYVIALATDAVPAEKTAAEQLQKYLQQVTGASFPVQSETQVAADAPQILVGAGPRVKALLPQQDWAGLGNEGILIKTTGNKLILAGGRPRGTLYAVFQFLEDAVGCRWWTPTESTIPQKPSLQIAPQNVASIPAFRYREQYTSLTADPVYATMLRLNGDHHTQDIAWGGHYTLLGFVHTFAELLPLDKYFATHPEWYSDPNNGFLPCTASSPKPSPQGTQPDLSNPAVLEEVTKNALVWIEKNPSAGYISISQNDNPAGYCRCAQCAALSEAEGSPSGPLIKFVNEVAERIHRQYPDFRVETLAYQYSQKPPKTIRPAKNVIIRLAPYMADVGHPFDSDWNPEVRDNLRSWAQIAPELFLWTYVVNFRGMLLPHPNWDGLAKDLRFFAANRVTGVFAQGDAYSNGLGDFVQLRTWLLGKLLWNPQFDQDKLVDEFLQGYYGAAAPFLRQYVDLLQKSFLEQQHGLLASSQDLSFFTLDTMNRSIRLFEQAENAVQGDKVLAARVRRQGLCLELARLHRFKALQQVAATKGSKLLGDPDPYRATQTWIAAARSFGINFYTEGVPFEEKVPALLDMNAPPMELPDFAGKYPAQDVIDIRPMSFDLYQKGTLSHHVPDPLAAGGIAAAMNGDIRDWAIQARLEKVVEMLRQDQWHVYALIRLETKPGEPPRGIALQAGIYDGANSKALVSCEVPVEQVKNDRYLPVEIGTTALSSGSFIWFAPAQNPAIEKIYVERIILLRDKVP